MAISLNDLLRMEFREAPSDDRALMIGSVGVGEGTTHEPVSVRVVVDFSDGTVWEAGRAEFR